MTSSYLTTPLAHRSAAITVILLLAAACGDPEPIADDQPPATVPTTTTAAPAPSTTVPSDDDGFGPPAAGQGEFGDLPGITMTGTAELAADGCWYLSGSGEAALLILPAGTEVGEGGTSLTTSDGTVIRDGTAVDATGGLVEVQHLPGGPDGRWAEYVGFCAPRYPFVAVADSLEPAFDPAMVDAAALAVELDAGLFDTDRGCGFGFTTGDADGRWRLEIWPVDGTPPEPGDVILPDGRFAATVVGGGHLFANHCDDVFEWFEPIPTTAFEWPIVAGTFIYPETSTEICAGEPPQTITLTGAIVETPIGPVELDPIEITNTGFGCFAG